MQFDLARPRWSLRAFLYLLYCPVVTAAFIAGASERTRPWTTHLTVVLLLLLLIVVVLPELLLRPLVWWVNRVRMKSVVHALRARPDTLTVALTSPPLPSMFALRRSGEDGDQLGVMSLALSGIAYQSSRQPGRGTLTEISWDELDSVQFRPSLEFAGNLRLRRHSGRCMTWRISNCADVVVALETIRDAQ